MGEWLNFTSAQFVTGLLIFCRFGALLFSAPIVSGKNVPVQVRVGLGAMITFIVTPLVRAARAPSLPLLVAGITKEILVGLILGWAAAVLFASVQMAGEWLDTQAGFSAAKLLNPAFDVQASPIGNFQYVLAALVFFAIGGHGTLIRAAVASLDLTPPGALALHAGALDDWMGLVTTGLWIALQLAAPMAAALFLSEIALALCNRALPQMNVLLLGMPVKGLMTLALLALCTPVIVRTLEGLVAQLGPELLGLLRAMGASA